MPTILYYQCIIYFQILISPLLFSSSYYLIIGMMASEISTNTTKIENPSTTASVVQIDKLDTDCEMDNDITNEKKIYNVDITAIQLAVSSCTASCSCICHNSHRITFPNFFPSLYQAC